jgi:hypothetical protein
MVLVLIVLLFNHSVLISFLSVYFFFGIRRVSIMTSAITREWVGFNTFAAATQTQLLQLLKRLKDEVPFSLIFVYIFCDFIYDFFCVLFCMVECEQVNNTSDGKMWCWKIFNYKFNFRRKSCYCQRLSG